MIIAAAKTIYNLGYNPQQVMMFSATDIDKKCVEMTFIQTSLLGLCGEITWGNTITLESWRTYRTMFYYSDTWQTKFLLNEMKNLIKNTENAPIKKEIENIPAPIIKSASDFTRRPA